jgi:hypothetical protein
MRRCPNCGVMAPGLYSTESGVVHCGCYHEGHPDMVVCHAGQDEGMAEILQQRAIDRFWRFVWIGA